MTVSDWATIIMAIATVGSLTAAIASAKAANRSAKCAEIAQDFTKCQTEQERKLLTTRAYLDLQNYLFFIYEYRNVDELELHALDDEQERKVLSNSLAHLEIFANGIKQGLYDFDTAYTLAHGYIDGSLREYIECLLDNKCRGKGADSYRATKELLKRMDMRTEA